MKVRVHDTQGDTLVGRSHRGRGTGRSCHQDLGNLLILPQQRDLYWRLTIRVLRRPQACKSFSTAPVCVRMRKHQLRADQRVPRGHSAWRSPGYSSCTRPLCNSVCARVRSAETTFREGLAPCRRRMRVIPACPFAACRGAAVSGHS